jgi:glycine cleavage system H lipoate-binding protein
VYGPIINIKQKEKKMSVLLFVVLTIILGIAIEYLVNRKKRASSSDTPEVSHLSPSTITPLVPEGIFLQPTFTWSKILDSGNMMMGIHPLLLGLVGKPEKFEKLDEGQEFQKGDTVLTLQKGMRKLRVKSPIKGTIKSINPKFSEEAWENLGQVWLYSIKPENLSSEISNWYIAEKSRTWITQKIEQIRSFLSNNVPHKQVGLTIADGGELPVGVLSQFDNAIWEDFETEFFES